MSSKRINHLRSSTNRNIYDILNVVDFGLEPKKTELLKNTIKNKITDENLLKVKVRQIYMGLRNNPTKLHEIINNPHFDYNQLINMGPNDWATEDQLNSRKRIYDQYLEESYYNYDRNNKLLKSQNEMMKSLQEK